MERTPMFKQGFNGHVRSLWEARERARFAMEANNFGDSYSHLFDVADAEWKAAVMLQECTGLR